MIDHLMERLRPGKTRFEKDIQILLLTLIEKSGKF